MAERPPKRYKPGELEETRKRLGPLEEAEARRIGRELGGEIGVEKDEPELEQAYRKLKEKHYRPSKGQPSAQSRPRQNRASIDKKTSREEQKPVERSYLQRMRLRFFASRPEYEIIKRSHAWLHLWPLYKQPLYLNSSFVTSCGSLFYRPLEKLVLAIRALLRRCEKNRVHQLRNPLYKAILETLKEWEIEELHREIGRIQHHPRTVSVQEFSRTLFYLYRPFLMLSTIDRSQAERAVRHLFDLSVLELPKKNIEIDRLERHYQEAREAMDYLFSILPYKLYPVLLLLFSQDIAGYRELIHEQRGEILAFFQLSEDELIRRPEKGEYEEEESADKENGEQLPEKVQEKHRAEGLGYRQSLILLEQLFPGSRISLPNREPDLFPYFSDLLQLPANSAMIPPSDPMQYVLVLCSVCEELLYGFRNADIEQQLLDRFEHVSEDWHRFSDELIGRKYLGSLKEYCRNIERSYDFAFSEYGKRSEADLLYLRKRCFFPDLQLSTPKYLRPRKRPELPKLFPAVRELKEILEALSQEEIPPRFRNIDDEYHFPLENSVSRRLTQLLHESRQQKSFRRLLEYCRAAVTALDFILLHQTKQSTILYRHVVSRPDIPLYAVEAVDSRAVIHQHLHEQKLMAEDPRASTSYFDPLSGFGGGDLLKEVLKDLESSQGRFSILRCRFHITMAGRAAELLKESQGGFDRQLFRLYGSDFLLLLPFSDTQQALALARQIARRGEDTGMGSSIYSFLSWNPGENQPAEKLMRELENALPAGELPEASRFFTWNSSKEESEEVH